MALDGPEELRPTGRYVEKRPGGTMQVKHLHGVVLEKLLQLPLSGRISEVPNVQPTSFIGTGRGSISRLRRGGSSAVGSLGGGSGRDRGDVVGGGFDGSRHLDGRRRNGLSVGKN